jgi:hypothetical protein
LPVQSVFHNDENETEIPRRKFDIGVFTQPGSTTDLTALKADFRFTPESRLRADIAPCPKSADFVAKVFLRHGLKFSRRGRGD